MDLDKILNEALNKAMIGKNRIKQVNSNTIAEFVNKHLEAINYSRCCKSDSEQLSEKKPALVYSGIDRFGNEIWLNKDQH